MTRITYTVFRYTKSIGVRKSAPDFFHINYRTFQCDFFQVTATFTMECHIPTIIPVVAIWRRAWATPRTMADSLRHTIDRSTVRTQCVHTRSIASIFFEKYPAITYANWMKFRADTRVGISRFFRGEKISPLIKRHHNLSEQRSWCDNRAFAYTSFSYLFFRRLGKVARKRSFFIPRRGCCKNFSARS